MMQISSTAFNYLQDYMQQSYINSIRVIAIFIENTLPTNLDLKIDVSVFQRKGE